MERREFLRSALAAGLAGGLGTTAMTPGELAWSTAGTLPRRRYAPGVELSVIGFGGIVVMGADEKAAARLVAEAVERGVNYFDVAPSYGGGEAEEKLGPALQPYRSRVFLACKTMARDARGARSDLDRSLKRLHTDSIDLYQLHAVTSLEDVTQALSPEGAITTFQQARAAGKVRFLGFSAHSEEAAIALMDRFDFDSMLFPLNYACVMTGGFGPDALARAQERGVTRLALKAMADRPWRPDEQRAYPKCWYRPLDDPAMAALALRFALSQDITAAIPPGDERLFRMALEIAADFRPLTGDELATLERRAAETQPLFGQVSH